MAVTGPRVRRAVPIGSGGRTPVLAATRRPPASWKVRDALYIMGGGLAFLLAALVTSLGVFELQGSAFSDSESRAALSAFVFTAFYLFLLWMIYVVVVHRYRCNWRMIGVRPVTWQWLAAVPVLLALLTLCYVLMLKGAVAIWGPTVQWHTGLTKSSTEVATHVPLLEAIVIVNNVVLTPISEELLFRGVFYQALRRTMPVGSAIAVSAVVFALMHMSLVMFVPFVLMGVLLGLVFEWSGSLIPTILLHACNNGIILLLIAGGGT
jgi:membrane protease YdiL (CAAX protease family)